MNIEMENHRDSFSIEATGRRIFEMRLADRRGIYGGFYNQCWLWRNYIPEDEMNLRFHDTLGVAPFSNSTENIS